MDFKFVLICQIISFSLANQDDIFIVSYFSYKRASFVVGFSCNDARG